MARLNVAGIMGKRVVRLCAVLGIAFAMAAPAAAAGSNDQSGGQSVGGAIKDGATAVGHATRDTAKAIGHGTRKAATAVGHGTRDAAKAVGHGFHEAWDDLTGKK
ncbi:MAG: hypothetical protein M0006_01760 [Magnetospirillum sp.]|nr:hypothetical protein [Magnetospirillum sp.]